MFKYKILNSYKNENLKYNKLKSINKIAKSIKNINNY